MRRLALLSMLALLVSSVGPLTNAHASSGDEQKLQDRDTDPNCSNETLKGVYGFSISGTRPAPPPLSGTPNYVPGTIEQVIGVGTQTFDGNGNFTQVSTDKGALSGILAPKRAGSGTYAVNSDCTGTTTLNIPGLPFAILADLVIVDSGKEFRGIIASPPLVMVSSVGRREK